MKSQYQIGAGKAKIVITGEMFPFGFGRGMSFTGLHDDLYVRAILLKNDEAQVLLIGVDLDSFGHIEEWKEKIRTVIDIPEDAIFVSHTHNHESIHVRNDKDDRPEGDADTAKAEKLVWEAMAKAIEDAASSVRPGKVAYGEGQCDININREFKYNGYYTIGRNPQGPSDKTVRVFRFSDLQDNPIAFFVNYAVHGSVMAEMMENADYKLEITSDLPGYTSRYIEERFDDQAVALWTSGAAGNQDARYRAQRYACRADGTLYRYNVGSQGYALCDMQARDLAEEVLRVSEEVMAPGETEGTLRCIQTVCTVPGKQTHGPGHGPGPKGPGGPGGKGPGPMDPSHVIAEGEMMKDVDINQANGDPVTVHTGLIVIGDTALAAVSGEETYALGEMVQTALREIFRHVVCLTQTNGYIGYMSEETGFERRVRSALVTQLARGQAEKVVVETPLRLAEQLGF